MLLLLAGTWAPRHAAAGCCCAPRLGGTESHPRGGGGGEEELGPSPPILPAEAKQGGVVSLAAVFQNSELIPQASAVNRACLHAAVQRSGNGAVGSRTAPGGVKPERIFQGLSPQLLLGLMGWRRFSVLEKKGNFLNKRNPGSRTLRLSGERGMRFRFPLLPRACSGNYGAH